MLQLHTKTDADLRRNSAGRLKHTGHATVSIDCEIKTLPLITANRNCTSLAAAVIFASRAEVPMIICGQNCTLIEASTVSDLEPQYIRDRYLLLRLSHYGFCQLHLERRHLNSKHPKTAERPLLGSREGEEVEH